MKDTEGDYRKDVALFRFGLISEALHLPPNEVAPWLKRQSAREHAIPGSHRRRVAVTTMRDWIRDYRRLGAGGLMPKRRQDLGAVRKMPPETVEILLATRRRNMDLSIRQIIDRVRSGGEVPDDVVLAARAVHRLFVREGLVRRRKEEPQQDLRRFAAKAAGQLWQSDVMHGPKVRDKDGRKRKTYLIALLDDATRLIPYAHFAFSENAAEYLVVLKEAVQRRGLVERLYCDNGASFRSRQLKIICGKLGISLMHARPYKPQGKDGAKTDIVIEQASGSVAGVEVKAAATVRSTDFRGLRKLERAVGNRFVRGIVLYDGEVSVPFGESFHAVPISRLWNMPSA